MNWSSFQNGVYDWLLACFGHNIASDKTERADRFTEEVLELLQSVDYPAERVFALIGYVYGRSKGETKQETGGVMVTLAAFCTFHDIDMVEAGSIELARVWTKIDAIRAKQAAKPTGSALPVAGKNPLTIKRFDVATVHPCGQQPRGVMIEDDDGEFVQADDIASIASHFFCIGHEDGVMQTKAAIIKAESGAVRGSWLPISQADTTITQVTTFGAIGMTIRNSDTYWVRDEDGRIYEACWTDHRNGYWWDLEDESPVDPVEFMPHPFDKRFDQQEGGAA